ncbi:cupin domain-containing protein [Methylobacillus gramineus]|uniref:cupin domain-containing protein n=1 Tax=Methylobacillus gramineus TaxID=755169 RepID=UPI001CFFC7BE|nr:cupin domain-containing protein [Methylobacillus gramineus]MCB5183627.1 cupin domain-containing protein [Methylobacillus gramineus]
MSTLYKSLTTLTLAGILGLVVLTASISIASAGEELDPKAISIKLPKDIKWIANPSGSESAVLVGDPSKPGLYVVLNKWKANHHSRPHSHPNDRFITVLSGTWWVATGADYNPAHFKPVPAGSFVTHYGNEIHYDGAKDEDTVLQIVGIGPATSKRVE